MYYTRLPLFLSVCLIFPNPITAEDWPQWRFDAGRTANSPGTLPDDLQLVWTKQFPKRVQVWDDPLNNDLMPYDKILEPVVMDGHMFAGFNESDKVVAWDVSTGAEVWRYYTDGPVRIPPVAWKGKVYFVSDDGSLYCVRSDTGELEWEFRGAPGEQKVLGNQRVISAWPGRGGPVIRDGIVYWAASIWPFMGTFIYALDAESGEVEWVNDGTSAQYIRQPHNAPSFAGVAPQGAFVATEDFLIVPGGRSVPAVFDRLTGEMKYFRLAEGGKGNGGSLVMANEEHFFAHTRRRGVRAFELQKGGMGSFLVNEPVLDGSLVYASSDLDHREVVLAEARGRVSSVRRSQGRAKATLKRARTDTSRAKAQKSLDDISVQMNEAEQVLAEAENIWKQGWNGKLIRAYDADQSVLWEIEADATGDLIKVGNRLYAAGAKSLTAYELVENQDEPSKVWSQPVDGTVLRLIAANEMLFAVTLEGTILAFGDPSVEKPEQPSVALAESLSVPSVPGFEMLLDQMKTKDGFVLCYGLENPAMLDSLLERTEFHIVGVDSDKERINSLRRKYDRDEAFYGNRIALHEGDPVSFKAPPYLASLVVLGEELVDRLAETEWIESVYASVRPYGGLLWLMTPENGISELISVVESADLPKAIVERVSLTSSKEREGGSSHGEVLYSSIHVTRSGALPGAADWTHQYGDIANTVKSDDERVKLPLGLLWFGGSSNMDVLPRHGHGPPEQVVGGRAIIEGMDSLSARDVYTGRVIWKRTIENLDTYGIYFNETYTNTPLSTAYNQRHIPGANGRGANYVATEDLVYVALEDYCEVLDAETGKTVNFIRLPLKQGGAVRPRWGFIGVYEDILLGGHDFAHFTKKSGEEWKKGYAPIEDLSASAGLVAFDRFTGEKLWQIPARHSFIHNGIVAGNGRVYCLDKLPKSAESKMSRRGKVNPDTYRVVALDYRTGKQLWEETGGVFGTWLSYSQEHDILLQAGARAKDRLSDEVGRGMIAYHGQTGSVAWKELDRSYTGPCIIHNELILTTVNSYGVSSGAFNLLDGSPHWITNPLTGGKEPWLISRAYGCNTPVASEHIMTFRSGAAGFYDLSGKSGTGNLGGFKSSCTSNLVIANGVLNAPDYTRTCTCAYQNQTSLALVHMPDMELWTYNKLGSKAETTELLQRAGINLGAPGDRLSEDGTLWLEFPGVGGDSPNVSVSVEGDDAKYFRHHATMIDGDGLSWVAASGVEGVEQVTIIPKMGGAKDRSKASQESDDGEPDSGEKTGPIYTVLLHFVEPSKLDPGERVFDVIIEGKEVLDDFDIVKETGRFKRSLVKQFKGIAVGDELEIKLVKADPQGFGPVLSGVELIAE